MNMLNHLESSQTDTVSSSKTLMSHANDSELRIMRLVHILVSNFEPIHYVCTMGIGISAGIMYQFPILEIRKGIKYVGLVYFYINFVVFIITNILFSLKYGVFPYFFKDDGRYSMSFFGLMHSPKSAFLGCVVMGGATLINMLYFMKPDWWIVIYTLWCINYASAFITACGAGFFLMTSATHLKNKDIFDIFSSMTPTVFLPFVTCTVSAASGGLISTIIPHPHLVLANTIISVILWAMALSVSIFLFSVFLTRLLITGIPRGPSAFTVFIPLGVLGQGSFGAMTNLTNLGELVVKHNFSLFGLTEVDNDQLLHLFSNGCKLLGIFIALVLSGFAVFFSFWSVFSVVYWYIGWPHVSYSTTGYHTIDINETDKYFSFKNRKILFWTPSMWACTFPIGTLALAFNELWKLTGITGFKIVATIYSISVIITTTYCMIGTLCFIVPWKELRNEFN